MTNSNDLRLKDRHMVEIEQNVNNLWKWILYTPENPDGHRNMISTSQYLYDDPNDAIRAGYLFLDQLNEKHEAVIKKSQQ